VLQAYTSTEIAAMEKTGEFHRLYKEYIARSTRAPEQIWLALHDWGEKWLEKAFFLCR
jgi:hypothetical protein